MRLAIAAGLALTLAACNSRQEQAANQLDAAAVQSDPAAAPALENAADAVRNGQGDGDLDAANGVAQGALATGGAQQAQTPPAPQP